MDPLIGMKAWAFAAITLLLAVVLLTRAPTVAAQEVPQGPWLDEIIWMEERDRSLVLDRILNGEADLFTADLTSVSDKQRALASDQIQSFPAYGLFDTLRLNPSAQRPDFPRNPFAIDEVREAMHWLVDRDFIVREIWGGFAIPHPMPWHPRSAEYGRGIADFLPLQEKYTYDPGKGRDQIFSALGREGWFVGTDGFWHDPEGRLVTLRGLIRTQDERLEMGRYYQEILRGLSFDVNPKAGFPVICLPPYTLCWADDHYSWHFYTGGWIDPRNDAWEDHNIWFWSCGPGYESYCAYTAEDVEFPHSYVINPELASIGTRLLTRDYSSLEERRQLLARGTELMMRAPIRLFIDARESLYVYGNHLEGPTFDLFGGPVNPWGIRTANARPDTDGLRRGRILNSHMFVDAWNPWPAAPGWLYDEVARWAMADLGMWTHPHTGRWIDIRTRATVETAGSDGRLPVPLDALVFDPIANAWVPVPPETTAVSRVVLDMVWGPWHHGPTMTTDDVLYHLSNGYRRSLGDIGMIPSLVMAASERERAFYSDLLKGIRVVDDDTLEMWIDVWHVDDQEIAGPASFFPSYPWEVGELALQTILDRETANNEVDAAVTGRPWLDLTKGPSLTFLEEDLVPLMAVTHIPPGMEAYITPDEAVERWGALSAWYTAKGNFWPSQGPFYLDEVDLPNRTTTMKAFREYPFRADNWEALTEVRLPTVRYVKAPNFVFAGAPGIFDLSLGLGGSPSDSLSVRWFLKNQATGAFVTDDVAMRTGQTSYRVRLGPALTNVLLIGNYELIVVASEGSASLPAFARTTFVIYPHTTYYESLFDCPGVIHTCGEGALDALYELRGTLDRIEGDIAQLQAVQSGIPLVFSALAAVSSVALGISVFTVLWAYAGRGRRG